MFKEIIQKLKTWRKGRQQLATVPDSEPETETPVEEIPGDVLALDDPEDSYGEGMGYKQKHPYLAQIWYIIRNLLRRWQH